VVDFILVFLDDVFDAIPNKTDNSHFVVASAVLRLYEEIEAGKETFFLEVKKRFEESVGKMLFVDGGIGDAFGNQENGSDHHSDEDSESSSEEENEMLRKEIIEKRLKEEDEKKAEKKKKKGVPVEENKEIDEDIEKIKQQMQLKKEENMEEDDWADA
jgi:hypothetical protein